MHDFTPGPPSPIIDLRLLGGAAVFGIGWGIDETLAKPRRIAAHRAREQLADGPGPAILSVLSGATSSLVFVGTMAGAMLVFESTKSDG